MRGASLLLALAVGCSGPTADPDEALSGGDTTVFDDTPMAFGHAVRNATVAHREAFPVGNSFFTAAWVSAPGSVDTRDGLGPVFNANACAACHVRDGRGRPPEPGEEMLSMLVRISLPGEGPHGGPLAVPGYGDQIQPRAIRDVPPEASTRVTWQTIAGSYADGTPFELRKPLLEILDPAFGPLPDALLTSMRVAPPTIGLGLLECVPESTILALEDAEDGDGDGISGRANWVFDVATGGVALGRFGWKANQPDLAQQDRGAFLGDMGLTTDLFPDDCDPAQTACAAEPSGGTPEISQQVADLVDLYVRLVAPPGRRDVDDPQVREGRDLFETMGCAGCHLPTLETGPCPDVAELGGQTIHAYTDLLLHDMGWELADGRPDFLAESSEWRTPPLWGIGLTERVSDHFFLLHDGRARGLAEAILWHEGEAEPSREAFRRASRSEREALLAFLRSL